MKTKDWEILKQGWYEYHHQKELALQAEEARRHELLCGHFQFPSLSETMKKGS